MNEVEKLAEIVGKYHMGCNLPVECNTECAKCCAKAILDAGYLPVQPVQLEPLTDKDYEKIIGYIPLEEHDVLKVCQATIAYNSKEQLYRVKQ